MRLCDRNRSFPILGYRNGQAHPSLIALSLRLAIFAQTVAKSCCQRALLGSNSASRRLIARYSANAACASTSLPCARSTSAT